MVQSIDATRILTAAEIRAVLDDLKRRARRSINSRQNLVVFRLATCCGLRASEIAGLRVTDAHCANSRPYLEIRQQLCNGIIKPPKGSRNGRKNIRRVPLWWDRSTLDNLEGWKASRVAQGATPADPFVCSQAKGTVGKPTDRQNVRLRFRVACRCLGAERGRELTVHVGRHSFVSHSLNGGRSVVEVQHAAGHANLATTSLYAHLVSDDTDESGDLFDFNKPR